MKELFKKVFNKKMEHYIIIILTIIMLMLDLITTLSAATILIFFNGLNYISIICYILAIVAYISVKYMIDNYLFYKTRRQSWN